MLTIIIYIFYRNKKSKKMSVRGALLILLVLSVLQWLSQSRLLSNAPQIYEEILNGLTKLPPLPEHIHLYEKFNVTRPHEGKHIPRNIFIAVRSMSDIAGHIWDFSKRNPLWHLNLCDNACKDEFMLKVYSGTGFWWAYHIINPEIGTAKAELWRLAVLYAYGGLYIDDDSSIKNDLDSTVNPEDKFIIAKEGYDLDDRCFHDNFPLSNKSMALRFGDEANKKTFYDNKFFLNWIMYSAPKSKFISRTMTYIVKIILGEYIFDPAVKMSASTHRGQLLQCVSTYPLTYVAKEMNLEDPANALKELRVEEHWFERIGAVFKVFYPDYRGDHWVKQLKNNIPYLRWYMNPLVGQVKEGKAEMKLIQTRGDRTVYVIMNSTKRAFQDLPSFVAMGFDFDQVSIITTDVFEQIPLGVPIPINAGHRLLKDRPQKSRAAGSVEKSLFFQNLKNFFGPGIF